MPTAYALARTTAISRALAADFTAQIADALTPEPKRVFMVFTQYMENYGFSEGGEHWKFKGGTDYIVTAPEGWSDDRIVDAVQDRVQWDNPGSRQYITSAEWVDAATAMADELYPGYYEFLTVEAPG